MKSEVGAGNCDSYTEVIAYYLEGLPQQGDDTSCQPRFLLEVVGPHLFISGVVFGEQVYVDRLTPPLWLVYQPFDEKEMIRTARTLKALKQACIELCQFATEHIRQPRFPSFYAFDDRQLTYVQEIQHHVFRCTITPENTPCIVKFCPCYCEQAHTVLAAKGYAPKLLHTEQFGMFVVVVMDEVPDAVNVAEYLKKHQDKRDNILTQCDRALDLLHESQFCHGDFRPSNILVTPTSKVHVIDFEWAGKEGEVTYPIFMNHSNIIWPSNKV